MRQTTSAKLASLGLAFALPLGIFLWTWWSPVTRYWVAYREWSPSEVSTARTAPGVEVFKSLSELRFDRPPWTTRAELLEAADNALLGKIQLRGLPEGSFHLPFAVSDISSGPP